MKFIKYIVAALTVVVTTAAYAFAPAIHTANPYHVITKFGTLDSKLDDAPALYFNGKKTSAQLQERLMFDHIIDFGDRAVVLGHEELGTSCPARYRWIIMGSVKGKPAIQQSPTFGTCSDLITLAVEDSTIVVRMPSYVGPGSDKYEQQRAARTVNTYRLPM